MTNTKIYYNETIKRYIVSYKGIEIYFACTLEDAEHYVKWNIDN